MITIMIIRIVVTGFIVLLGSQSVKSDYCRSSESDHCDSDRTTLDLRWQEEVRLKLVALFGNTPEEREEGFHILLCLDKELDGYKGSDRSPSSWQSLKTIMNSGDDQAFKDYAKTLGKDLILKHNPDLKETMQDYQWFEEYYDDLLPESKNREKSVEMTIAGGSMGLSRVWHLIPVKKREPWAMTISKLLEKTAVQAWFERFESVNGLVRTFGSKSAMSTRDLAALYISYEAYRSISRWYNGEITGAQCVDEFLDSAVGIAGGYVGSAAGSAIGTYCLGPVGSFLGAIVGGAFGSIAGRQLKNWLTELLFSLSRAEAVKKAHRFLGVPLSASNDELNKAYRGLLLKYHPDMKDGSHDDFIKLQAVWALIWESKGIRTKARNTIH